MFRTGHAQVAGTSAPPSSLSRLPKRSSDGCGEILPTTRASPSRLVIPVIHSRGLLSTRRLPDTARRAACPDVNGCGLSGEPGRVVTSRRLPEHHRIHARIRLPRRGLLGRLRVASDRVRAASMSSSAMCSCGSVTRPCASTAAMLSGTRMQACRSTRALPWPRTVSSVCAGAVVLPAARPPTARPPACRPGRRRRPASRAGSSGCPAANRRTPACRTARRPPRRRWCRRLVTASGRVWFSRDERRQVSAGRRRGWR